VLRLNVLPIAILDSVLEVRLTLGGLNGFMPRIRNALASTVETQQVDTAVLLDDLDGFRIRHGRKF
jgi:hypothetical protein